jgi:uncharacterized tellurite resistance protein B-like protein
MLGPGGKMQLAMPPEPERIFMLRAMKTVALADGELHPKERRLIEIAANTLGVDVLVDELDEISAADLAAGLAQHEARESLVKQLVMLTTLDGEVTEDEVERLEEFAQALGSHERAVHNLRQLLEGHLKRMMADIVRRSFMPRKIKWLVTEADLSSVWGVAKVALGVTDPKLAARCEALGKLPEGTLGRVLHDHHVDNGFFLPGQKDGFPMAMAFHDLGHVVSGYGTDSQGELLVAGFQAGYLEEDPLVMYLMISMLFQLGIEPIAELRGVEPERNQLDLDAYEDAYRRGAARNQSLLNWDPWPYMEWPLEKLRAELGVPPLGGEGEPSPET